MHTRTQVRIRINKHSSFAWAREAQHLYAMMKMVDSGSYSKELSPTLPYTKASLLLIA